MIERLDYVSINGAAIASMAKAKKDMPSIGRKLRAVIELRVSQINGCAYCVDLHTIEARHAGETTQRLDCLTVWREVQFFVMLRKQRLNGLRLSPKLLRTVRQSICTTPFRIIFQRMKSSTLRLSSPR